MTGFFKRTITNQQSHMLFHAFCEFADGTSSYLHIKTSTKEEACQKAFRHHNASVVLFIVSSLDPYCELLELDPTSLNSNIYSGEETKVL